MGLVQKAVVRAAAVNKGTKMTRFRVVWSLGLLALLSIGVAALLSIPAGLANRGYLALLNADYPEAAGWFQKSLDRRPNFPALRGMAEVRLRSGDPQAAETWAKRALILKPLDRLSLLALADACWQQGKETCAADAWRQIDDAEAFLILGQKAQTAEDSVKAEMLFELAVESASDDWRGYYRLASVQESIGNTVEADANFRRSVELAPQDAQMAVLLRVAQSRYKNGEFNAAIPLLAEYIQANPEDGQGYYWRGICYRKLKMFVEARPDLEKAFELMPKDINAGLQLGYVLEKLGELDSAADVYQQVLKLDPQQEDAANGLKRTEKQP